MNSQHYSYAKTNIPGKDLRMDINGVTSESVDKSVGDIDDGQTFGWTSEYQNNLRQRQIMEVEHQVSLINEDFDTPAMDFKDPDGNPIVNATPENKWFADNVFFLISIGAIFDEEDEVRLQSILSCFHNNYSQAFLMNTYQRENYRDSEMVAEFETLMKIGHGNYHVLLLPIVTASPEDLLNAPDKLYSRKSAIGKYTTWPAITEYMKGVVSRFGLLTARVVPSSSPANTPSNAIGQEGLDVSRTFNINGYIDEECASQVDSVLEYKQSREKTFKTRVRTTDLPKVKRTNLYTQIRKQNQSGVVDDPLKNSKLGVELRFNERKNPNRTTQNEYQLYDDKTTFGKGLGSYTNPNGEQRNAGVVKDMDGRITMPVFQQTGVRGANHRRPPAAVKGFKSMNVNRY